MKALIEIPKIKYEGYVWIADQKKPKTLQREEYSFENIPENSFIVEALLWNAEEQISIMIRHTGKYHVQQFKLNELPTGHQLVEKAYLPHRLGDEVKRIYFQQVWVPVPDALCEGMPVMTMKALIFTGFKSATVTK